MWARIIGLRGNATAIAVPSRIRDVTLAATASGRNGSCWVSDDQRQSYPIASTLRAKLGIDLRSWVSMPTSSFTGVSLSAGVEAEHTRPAADGLAAGGVSAPVP